MLDWVVSVDTGRFQLYVWPHPAVMSDNDNDNDLAKVASLSRYLKMAMFLWFLNYYLLILKLKGKMYSRIATQSFFWLK